MTNGIVYVAVARELIEAMGNGWSPPVQVRIDRIGNEREMTCRKVPDGNYCTGDVALMDSGSQSSGGGA